MKSEERINSTKFDKTKKKTKKGFFFRNSFFLIDNIQVNII